MGLWSRLKQQSCLTNCAKQESYNANLLGAFLSVRIVAFLPLRELPELSKGSLLAILVCLFLSFPVGVAAAVWFEDFAPEGRRTDLFRINVYNLAAVPSIIFGLLGLAVFLNFFSMPRGAPLVGGMVLALMTLPTVIVVSASALRAVPSNLREAALALEEPAAKKRSCTMFCPMLCPGILTGTIIGLARAFGRNRTFVVDWHDRVSDFCA